MPKPGTQVISIAVAAKQLDAQQMQGEAVVKLIETAAQLIKEAGKGANIDSLLFGSAAPYERARVGLRRLLG